MKLRKITAIAAAAMLTAAVSASVSAEETITAKIGYTDSNWTFQDWESAVEVTGDGTYTITTTAAAGTEQIGVFVVDLEGMYAAYPEATATLDKIEVDGAEISFDASKIVYGDIEEKGNYRIDIFNMYSDTKNDPGINVDTPIAESLAVTFTVSGLGSAAPAETAAEETAPAAEESAPAETAAEEAPAPAEDTAETTTPDTGNTSAFAVGGLMALAALAAVAARKR